MEVALRWHALEKTFYLSFSMRRRSKEPRRRLYLSWRQRCLLIQARSRLAYLTGEFWGQEEVDLQVEWNHLQEEEPDTMLAAALQTTLV